MTRSALTALFCLGLLGFTPTSASSQQTNGFELADYILVVPADLALQVALGVPDFAQPPGFLERCARVEGSIVVREAGSGGVTLASFDFDLSPGDIQAVSEPLGSGSAALTPSTLSEVGTYLEVVVLLDERAKAHCLEGAVDVIGGNATPRPQSNKRKTLKAVDL